MIMTTAEYSAIYTPLLLTVVVLGGILLEISAFGPHPRRQGIYVLAGIIIVLLLTVANQATRINIGKEEVVAFGGSYFFEMFSAFFNYLFLIAAAGAVVLSLTYFQGREGHRGEYYLLIATATIGMCMMAAAHDLMILFIGLEIMSIAVYVIVGVERGRPRSGEASIKYLLLGAFGSAILLFGIALLYGLSGKTDYESVAAGTISALDNAWEIVRLPSVPGKDAEGFTLVKLLERAGQLAAEPGKLAMLFVMLFGVGFVLAGFFFKVAAAPFHMWTPDVYEGAPTPITAYMATGVKAAAFAALLRLMLTAFSPLWGLTPLYQVLAVAAVLTMTVGNFTAIAQKSVKRMLAYSSIAHAGYLLVGLAALAASGQFFETMNYMTLAQFGFKYTRPVVFYLLAYTIMNLGAFGVIVVLGQAKKDAARSNDGETLADFAGLGTVRPGLAAAMTIFMLSLAGVPPLVGFTAKFYLFESAVVNRLYVLAIIGVLNSVVSAYYYLRVVRVMYMAPAETEVPEGTAAGTSGAMALNILMAALVVAMGIAPGVVLGIVEQAISLNMLQIPYH